MALVEQTPPLVRCVQTAPHIALVQTHVPLGLCVSTLHIGVVRIDEVITNPGGGGGPCPLVSVLVDSFGQLVFDSVNDMPILVEVLS